MARKREIELAGDTVAAHLTFANCCENCQHCVEDHSIDDPIGYTCAAYEPEPERPDDSECYNWSEDDPRWKQLDEHSEWMTRNQVFAGTLCARFTQYPHTRQIISRKKYLSENVKAR